MGNSKSTISVYLHSDEKKTLASLQSHPDYQHLDLRDLAHLSLKEGSLNLLRSAKQRANINKQTASSGLQDAPVVYSRLRFEAPLSRFVPSYLTDFF